MSNPTDTTTLPAGRELDAAIAQHLFGWRWMERTMPDVKAIALFPSATSDLMNPGNWRDVTDEPVKALRFRDWTRDIPRYSTDATTMLAVLEKMIERGWVYQLGGEVHHQPDAAFWHHGTPGLLGNAGEGIRAAGDTLPEAVCIAALRALGVLPLEEAP